MTGVDQFIERYVSVWNESDVEIRRQLISTLWSEEAALFNRVADYQGHGGIEQAVANSYERFVARGFVFRARDDAVTHHGAVRFSWEMVTAHDAQVDSVGTQFLVLESDGRIRLDYQFIETLPTT
jgi:hypothetical protein